MKKALFALLLLGASPVAAQDYVESAAAAIRDSLVDPFSVREAERTPPFQYMRGVALCSRFYAKNRMGGYGGQAVFTVLFKSTGEPTVLPETNVGCDRYGWKPFPELAAD